MTNYLLCKTTTNNYKWVISISTIPVSIMAALIATLGTWLVTALGAASVLFFKHPKEKLMDILLGFAAGVMISASFWSLLQPAVRTAEEYLQISPAIVVTVGFTCGALFMWTSDKIVNCVQRKFTADKTQNPNSTFKRIVMLVLSITLHNIPEGLAVGVAFGALSGHDATPDEWMGAISIAIGIGLQNFPEGAAVSLPLRREGYSRRKSFFFGQASGIVEPISGVIGALLVMHIQPFLPFALSFAAGSMILVAAHELIPECQISTETKRSYCATMGIIVGFAGMMFLDVFLG
jgi:Predicted divalent heavy-metal cations transporter